MKHAVAAIIALAGIMSLACGDTVGYWKFDEGSGTTIVDTTGLNANGTLDEWNGSAWVTQTNPTWVQGASGWAVGFNGTNQGAIVPDSSALDVTTAVTLEAIIKPSTFSGTGDIISKDSAYQLKLGGDLKSITFLFRSGSSWYGGSVTLSTALSSDEWTHIAITYDSTLESNNIKVYVDYELVSQKTVTGTINTTTSLLTFGAEQVGVEYYKGDIDAIRISNVALSSSEFLPIPEPATLSLIAAGSLALLGCRKK